MTKIILKSNIPMDDPDNDLILAMLEEISNKKPILSNFVSIPGGKSFTQVYLIDCTNEDNDYVRMVVKSINSHRYTSLPGYERITPNDFDLIISSDSLELVQFVNDVNSRFLQDRIKTLEYIASVQVESMSKIKDQIETLYNFIHKTGIVSLVKTYPDLIETLDQQGIIKASQFELTAPSLH